MLKAPAGGRRAARPGGGHLGRRDQRGGGGGRPFPALPSSRLTELWTGLGRRGRLLRLAGGPAVHGGAQPYPPLHRRRRCSNCSAPPAGRARRGPGGALPVRGGEHRARRRALVRQRSAGRGGARLVRGAGAAAAGRVSAASTSWTAAWSTASRWAGPSPWAPGRSTCCRSAGSNGRSAPRGCRGRSPPSRSRSPAGTASPATWPTCRRTSPCTCCPAARPSGEVGGTSSQLRHRAFGQTAERIDRAYAASSRYLDAALDAADGPA